jgi:hypothetical protein
MQRLLQPKYKEADGLLFHHQYHLLLRSDKVGQFHNNINTDYDNLTQERSFLFNGRHCC